MKGAIIFVHGYTSSDEDPQVLEFLREIQERVPIVDVFPVCLPLHGKALQYNIEDIIRNKFMQGIDEIIDVYEDIKEVYNKVIIIGHSLGGFLTLRASQMAGIGDEAYFIAIKPAVNLKQIVDRRGIEYLIWATKLGHGFTYSYRFVQFIKLLREMRDPESGERYIDIIDEEFWSTYVRDPRRVWIIAGYRDQLINPEAVLDFGYRNYVETYFVNEDHGLYKEFLNPFKCERTIEITSWLIEKILEE